MPRSEARQDPADQEPEPAPGSPTGARPEDTAEAAGPDTKSAAARAALGSLSDLPVAGLTRRRIGLLVAAMVAAWVIVLFARQVSEASDAAGRADAMRASNVSLQAQVAALTRERQLVESQAYVEQQAREYRLGTSREIPFILADDAPPLPSDAPGSAAVKLGASTRPASPLDSWLDLLFGSPSGVAGS